MTRGVDSSPVVLRFVIIAAPTMDNGPKRFGSPLGTYRAPVRPLRHVSHAVAQEGPPCGKGGDLRGWQQVPLVCTVGNSQVVPAEPAHFLKCLPLFCSPS